MHGRTAIRAAAGSAATGALGALMTPKPAAAALDQLTMLTKSAKMPMLFVGHGSPMNAIGDNDYRRCWQALGADLLARYAGKWGFDHGIWSVFNSNFQGQAISMRSVVWG